MARNIVNAKWGAARRGHKPLQAEGRDALRSFYLVGEFVLDPGKYYRNKCKALYYA
jgi:hypothetical protein